MRKIAQRGLFGLLHLFIARKRYSIPVPVPVVFSLVVVQTIVVSPHVSISHFYNTRMYENRPMVAAAKKHPRFCMEGRY